eukprot:g18702.t1
MGVTNAKRFAPVSRCITMHVLTRLTVLLSTHSALMGQSPLRVCFQRGHSGQNLLDVLVFAQGPSIWPSNQFAAEGSRLSSTVDAGSAKLGSRIVAGDQPARDRYMIQNIAME